MKAIDSRNARIYELEVDLGIYREALEAAAVYIGERTAGSGEFWDLYDELKEDASTQSKPL